MIFISYAQEDGDIAGSLATAMQSAGIEFFLADRNILSGEEWDSRLRQAMRDSDRVLLLMTPRSKSSLWIAAEAGAAWVLEKPLIPVLMFLEPKDLIEPIRRFQTKIAETPEQVADLIRDLKSTSLLQTTKNQLRPHYELENVTVDMRLTKRRSTQVQEHYDRTPHDHVKESFQSEYDWPSLIKVGHWTRDSSSKFIYGSGMNRYLLSGEEYGPESYTIDCRLRFLEFMAEDMHTRTVNAGIVLGWRALGISRKYHHLLLTGERLLIERVGYRGGNEYLDYQHLDAGVPFKLVPGKLYEISVRVQGGGKQVNVACNGADLYSCVMEGLTESGRIGIRPWRTKVEVQNFDIAKDRM